MYHHFDLLPGDGYPLVTDEAIRAYIARAIDDDYWADAVVARELVVRDDGTWYSSLTGLTGAWYVDGPTLDVIVGDE